MIGIGIAIILLIISSGRYLLEDQYSIVLKCNEVTRFCTFIKKVACIRYSFIYQIQKNHLVIISKSYALPSSDYRVMSFLNKDLWSKIFFQTVEAALIFFFWKKLGLFLRHLAFISSIQVLFG